MWVSKALIKANTTNTTTLEYNPNISFPNFNDAITSVLYSTWDVTWYCQVMLWITELAYLIHSSVTSNYLQPTLEWSYNHPSACWKFWGMLQDPLASRDVVSRDSDPTPHYSSHYYNDHGTRCAGVIASAANNSYCSVGIAHSARIGGMSPSLYISCSLSPRLLPPPLRPTAF